MIVLPGARHVRRCAEGKQQGAALMVSLVLLVAITLLGLGAMSTSTMELRMAGNVKSNVNNFQTIVSAIDFVLSDVNNLPSTGPLNTPSPVPLSDSTSLNDTTVTAESQRLRECVPCPRMRDGSGVQFACFEYEISADFHAVTDGRGRSGGVQGFTLRGPKC